jgi:hypothetical protein
MTDTWYRDFKDIYCPLYENSTVTFLLTPETAKINFIITGPKFTLYVTSELTSVGSKMKASWDLAPRDSVENNQHFAENCCF